MTTTKEYHKATRFNEKEGERIAEYSRKRSGDMGWCWDCFSGAVVHYSKGDEVIEFIKFG